MSVDQRIERLCRAIGDADFAALARRAGAVEIVAQIVDAVRSGAATAEGLPDAIDAVDEAFARVGVDGLTTSPRVFRSERFDGGHPAVEAWVCPLDACSRTEPTSATEAPAPRCPIADAPLARMRSRL
jgi:hypothetical protein